MVPGTGFEAKFGNKQMILVLDNSSYHNGYGAEVQVPEGSIKGYNAELLRTYKWKNIPVEREVTGSAGVGSKEYYLYIFKAPATRTFPQRNSKCGILKEYVDYTEPGENQYP